MKELAGHKTIESRNIGSASRGRRVLEIAAEEVGQLRPRLRVVQGLAGLLPQFCFNRLRTAIWRAARVEIGEGSLVMGQITLSGLGDWSSLLTIGESTYITGPL